MFVTFVVEVVLHGLLVVVIIVIVGVISNGGEVRLTSPPELAPCGGKGGGGQGLAKKLVHFRRILSFWLPFKKPNIQTGKGFVVIVDCQCSSGWWQWCMAGTFEKKIKIVLNISGFRGRTYFQSSASQFEQSRHCRI